MTELGKMTSLSNEESAAILEAVNFGQLGVAKVLLNQAQNAASGMTRAAILATAREAVTKDRAATHGDLESSFGQIAAIWSVRLGVTVTPAQVAIMMVDLKTVRAWGNPGHADNWVDIAGYAACGGELAAATSSGVDA